LGPGDEQLEALFDRYGPLVLRRARRLLGDPNAAWDVVQEVFRCLLEKRTRFWKDVDPLPFLYRATTNAAIDYWRRNARLTLDPSEARPASAPDAAQSVEHRQLLRQLVDKLTRRQAAIVAHLFIDGMTQDEIALVLDVSRKTVVRELAAVRGLARDLGSKWGGSDE
jgi:RNA polymerase sigma-70 factor (ECF subfamily)